MWVKFTGRYSSTVGSWPEGKIADVDDRVFAFIQRDAPGICVRWDIETNAEWVEPEEDANPGADVPDITDETESGLDVPDRRARGGRKRS